MTKAEIRIQIRDTLATQKYSMPILSEEICKSIIASEAYKKADVVLAYMSLPDEVNLDDVISDACVNNKKVYIPRVVPDSSYMDFYEYDEAFIERGSFGIAEPVKTDSVFNPDCGDCGDDLSKINLLILVPGRAFTKDGARLGRGKGYYDTYLARLQNIKAGSVVKAGVCFECQIVESIPVEPHDFTMDMIFS